MKTKFRGFNKKWHYGDHVRQARALINGNPAFNLYDCEIADYIIYSENGVLQIIEVEPESVSQYAGLNDINDKEIYEGDILQVDEKSTYGGQYKCPVKWLSYKDGKDSWAFWGVICLECIGEPIYNDKVNSLYTRGFLTRSYGSCIQLTEMTRNSFGSIEVIGNLVENPELEVKCKT